MPAEQSGGVRNEQTARRVASRRLVASSPLLATLRCYDPSLRAMNCTALTISTSAPTDR